MPRGVGACIHTLPESVVSLIPWRPRCSEEAAVPLDRPQSRKRCSNAGTFVARDNRLATSVRTHFFDFGSVAAVDRKLFRSADAWDEFSFAGSPRGEEDGEGELREHRLRVESAQVVRSSALGGRPPRRGESARTRWSCGGVRPPNFQTRRLHGRAHWTRRRRYGRAGVHTEHAVKRVGSAVEWQGGATCTVEATCARDIAQAAGVCSQHAWCGGEGDCASRHAESSAEEARICVEERAFRAR